MELLPLPVFSPVGAAGNDRSSAFQGEMHEQPDTGFASLFHERLSAAPSSQHFQTSISSAARDYHRERPLDSSRALDEPDCSGTRDSGIESGGYDLPREAGRDEVSLAASGESSSQPLREDGYEKENEHETHGADSMLQGNKTDEDTTIPVSLGVVEMEDMSGEKSLATDFAVFEGSDADSLSLLEMSLIPLGSQFAADVGEDVEGLVEELAADAGDSDDAMLLDDADLALPVWIAQAFIAPAAAGAVAGDATDTVSLLPGTADAALGKALQAWLAQDEVIQSSSAGIDADANAPSSPAFAVATQVLQTGNSSALREAISAAVLQLQSVPARTADTAPVAMGEFDEGVDVATSLTGIAHNTAAMRVQAMTPQQALQQAGVMAEKLAAQIVWMQSQHIQRAEMRLSPENLGPLQIQLDIQRDQASVSVSSAHQQVREWLDAGQFRLRDLLGQSGLQLSSYSVSDHGSHNAQQQQGEEGARQQATGTGIAQPDNHDEPEAIVPLRMGIGLVDNYA